MDLKKTEGAAPQRSRPEDQLVRSALYYSSELKWQVIPIRPRSKLPLTKHGLKDGTLDAAQIRAWWAAQPAANVGVVTGQASGITVLDIDERHGGFESLAELTKVFGELPATPMTLTGGGGWQYFFKAPAAPLRSRVGVKPGIDLRAEGGYVVAPPSIHPSGRTYTWEVDARIDQVPLACIPDWLLRLLLGGDGQATRRDWSILKLATPCGSRNQTLASLAGHLFRRYVDPQVAVLLLQAWNRSCTEQPLSEAEFDRTLESIASRELQRRNQERRS